MPVLRLCDCVCVLFCSVFFTSAVHASSSCRDVTERSRGCRHSRDTEGRCSMLLCRASIRGLCAESSPLISCSISGVLT